jgi:hypothetical protein
MVAQLNGEEPRSRLLQPVQHVLEDRAWLAEHLFKPVTDSSFNKIVKRMASLCTQREDREVRRARHHTSEIDIVNQHGAETVHIGLSPSLAMISSSTQTSWPAARASAPARHALSQPGGRVTKPRTLLTALTCLFCYEKPGRKQTFARPDGLRKHYRSAYFYHQLGVFPCPIQFYRQIISDADKFSAHASKVHKSDVGVRTSIMGSAVYTARSGRFVSFSL